MYIITVDGGTTNTRITLTRDGAVLDRVKLPVGAGKGREALTEAIGQGLETLLSSRSIPEKEIEAMILSGMIGSEMGLLEVPHVSAPVDKDAMAKALVQTSFPSLLACPFYFVPGVKNQGHDPETFDMMRGEETEFFGLEEEILFADKTAVVLPGTHTKLILGDEGLVTDCYTAMGGEMIHVLSRETILKNSLPLPLPKEVDETGLFHGFDTAQREGISRALFKIRILDRSFSMDKIFLASFFVGAVLCDDIQLIARQSRDRQIVVGGSEPLRSIFSLLLSRACGAEVKNPGREAEQLSVFGGLKLYDAFKNMI